MIARKGVDLKLLPRYESRLRRQAIALASRTIASDPRSTKTLVLEDVCPAPVFGNDVTVVPDERPLAGFVAAGPPPEEEVGAMVTVEIGVAAPGWVGTATSWSEIVRSVVDPAPIVMLLAASA